jgi:hypothetical protein
MTRSKYPPFERVTAGKLAAGDLLLVRDRLDDRFELDDQDDVPWSDREHLPPGVYHIAHLHSTLTRGGRKAVRHFHLTLDSTHALGQRHQHITVSFVQRLNRVVDES